MTHNRNTVKLPRPAGWALAALCAVLLAGLPGTGHADIRHKERCNITQLVLEDCPNGIRADFDNGRHLWSFAVAGPIAFAEKMETYLEQPVAVYIVDYPTRNDENRRMVDVEKAWFLFDAEGDETLSQAPHIYGFREKDAAVAAQKEVGGELKRWDYVFGEVTAIAADWDRSSKHRHGSLREGRK